MAANTVNGKRYIGITTKSISRREAEHASHAAKRRHKGMFHAAIRKYGRQAFEWSVILVCETARDALQEEIRLIAELKPEYNSTAGGETAPPMTPENIERIRKLHTGNKYRLGMSHSEAVKAVLSARTLVQWREHRAELLAAQVPRPNSRKVVCLDDGEVYESASAAARFYALPKSLIIQVCLHGKNRKTAGGRVFRYFGEHEGGQDLARKIKEGVYAERKVKGSTNQVPVVCVDDGKVYRSYQQAADAYGTDAVSVSAVCRGLRGRKTAGGKRFRHASAS